ncbi:hypothetical protein BC941DRAFT_69178 [Chlamydoabsidia padenii]|nr:hypothetical protein BC941DRAFT_69178 [Chlamydoabsidia padenii]
MTETNEDIIIDIPSSRRGSCQDQAGTEGSHRQSKMKAAPKAKEYIKMIHLILSKLTKRKRPPPPIANFLQYTQPDASPLLWDHDDTIDLCIKLRSVLIICENTELYILDQRGRALYTSPGNSRSSSPVRPESSAHSPNSPRHHQQTKKDSSSVFDTVLQLVNDLISHDCRHIGLHPKPSRPPLTLQTTIIDLAILLIQAREDIPSLYKIGMVMLPAFEIFPDSTLKVKLLSFFIDILLPKLMQSPHVAKDNSIKKERLPTLVNDTGRQRSRHSGTTPIINVQSPEGQETKMGSLALSSSTAATPTTSQANKSSHLTIDTHTASSSSALLSPTTHHSVDTTHQMVSLIEPIQQYALFTPLLTFMIQYLDPYLDMQHMAMEDLPAQFSGKTYSIVNFHKALRFMIQHKPDLYLDILQLIAYSMDDVKFRACQVLFHYYSVSMGHAVIAESLPKLGVVEEIGILDKERLVQQKHQQQQRHQQSMNSVFTDEYHDSSSNDLSTSASTVYNNGINRKYGTNSPASTPLRSNTRDELEEGGTEKDGNDHVWYSHMFVINQHQHHKSSSDSVSDMVQPPVPGILTLVSDDMNGTYCSGCYKLISGFGLRCYQCKRSVHYQCYNYCLANDDLDIMLYVKEGGIQKVVSPQFCHVQIQPRFVDIAAGHEYQWDKSNRSPKIYLLGHQFHLVNLYTLLLCACCRMPLYGISQQGYRCSICNRFVHPACLDRSEHEGGFHHPLSTVQDCQPYRPLLESDTRISSKELSDSLVQFYGDMVPTRLGDLAGRSYEEVGTMVNVLVLQDNILRYGVSAGCLLVDYVPDDDEKEEGSHDDSTCQQACNDPLLHNDKTSELDDPGSTSNSRNTGRESTDMSMCPLLRRAIELCFQHIKSVDCRPSSFLADFKHNREWSQTAYECLLSREDYLSHIGAMMKSLTSSADTDTEGALSSSDTNKDLLQVTPSYFVAKNRQSNSPDGESMTHRSSLYGQPPPEPNNILDRDTLLSWTMDNLYIKSRKAGEILLQQMRNLGLFERYDASPILFTADRWTRMDDSTHDCQTLCIFPVPYAIDCSPHVETLINSVESCLNDIDIAINECGMLLLTRRCWPDPFMSPYTSERLMVAILRWILLEDEKLTALYAAFTISNNIQLPGVKQNRWAQTAQSALLTRMKGVDSPVYNRYQVGGSSNSGSFNGIDDSNGNKQHNFVYGAGVSSGAGNVYVTTRNVLRDRYLATWMSTMHDIDPVGYATLLNDAIDQVVESVMDDTSISELGHASVSQDKVKGKKQRFIHSSHHSLSLFFPLMI